MSSAQNCPTCGSSLPHEAPEGLCPKCLFRAGLDDTSPPPLMPSDIPEARMPGQAKDGFVRYFGDYEIQSEIARGGMGVVYRARQVSLDRMVALKMILPNMLDDDAVRRFRQEVESAANLDHPNIVPVFEFGQHEGQHFYGMKLI
jgi:eukaryotic-like serine/threonine-protein kinase